MVTTAPCMHGLLLIFQAGQHSRCSDDGEPHGTAGRPILEAIRGEGLDYTAVLVTRYACFEISVQ